MSRDELHSYANLDTPQHVRVPNNWPGLISWAVGRFGVGIVFAAAVAWFANRVYDDMKVLNGQVLDAFKEQARTNVQQVMAIQELTRAIDDAHRRATSPRNP